MQISFSRGQHLPVCSRNPMIAAPLLVGRKKVKVNRKIEKFELELELLRYRKELAPPVVKITNSVLSQFYEFLYSVVLRACVSYI